MSKFNAEYVKEKPMRGREMKTKAVPAEMFETMKLVSAKKTLKGESLTADLEKSKDDKVHLYHEGYVDDKLFLVPDENLQTMRDDVQTRIRTKGLRSMTGTVKDSYEVTDYDRSNRKIGKIIHRVHWSSSDSDEEKRKKENDEERNEVEEEEKEKSEEGGDKGNDEKNDGEEEEEKVVEEEKEKVDEEELKGEEENKIDEERNEVEEEEKEKSEEEDDKGKDEKNDGEEEEEKVLEEEEENVDEEEFKGEEENKIDEEEEKDDEEKGETNDEEEGGENSEENVDDKDTGDVPKPFSLSTRNPTRLRLLISGHFRKDQKPIYIIQEYNEELNLFKDQKADFQSHRKLCEDGIDAFVSGRFYDETILEEAEGKPVALNIKPQKIVIDENISNVYDDYFEQVYNLESTDVLLSGEFLKSDITKRITPFLSLGVRKGEKSTENNMQHDTTKSSTDIFTCQLKPTVPFTSSAVEK